MILSHWLILQIEAVSFQYYLEYKGLIAFPDVQALLAPLLLTPDDYLLGIADLTGEVMRYAINSIGAAQHSTAVEACAFLREVRNEFELLRNAVRGLDKKLDVMKTCLNRVEDACYAIQVRGSEYPPEMYADIINSFNTQSQTQDDS